MNRTIQRLVAASSTKSTTPITASGRLPPNPCEAPPRAATAHALSWRASTLGLWLDASIIVLSACYRPAGNYPAAKALGVIAPAREMAFIAHPLS